MTQENENTVEPEVEVTTTEEVAQESEVNEAEEVEIVVEEAAEEKIDIKDHEDYKEINDKYIRLYAEFDNFRRRSAKESISLIESANAKLLGELVDVVENFDRSLSEEHKASNLEEFEKGISLIHTQLSEILSKAGLVAVDPVGEKFDPNEHEALMNQPSPDVEEGNVLTVFQKGYKVKEKIIKHAKVIVSAGA